MKAIFTCLLLFMVNGSFAQSYIPLPVGNARWMENYTEIYQPEKFILILSFQWIRIITG